MKIFSDGKNKTLDRRKAEACAGVNLLATPGLGTVMAGRWLAGAVQLAFSVSGFTLFTKWFYTLFQNLSTTGARGPAWQWQTGLILFGVGWLGSAWSSFNFIRESTASVIPPKLDGTRG